MRFWKRKSALKTTFFFKCGEVLIDHLRLVRGGSPRWRLALNAKRSLAEKIISRATRFLKPCRMSNCVDCHGNLQDTQHWISTNRKRNSSKSCCFPVLKRDLGDIAAMAYKARHQLPTGLQNNIWAFLVKAKCTSFLQPCWCLRKASLHSVLPSGARNQYTSYLLTDLDARTIQLRQAAMFPIGYALDSALMAMFANFGRPIVVEVGAE